MKILLIKPPVNKRNWTLNLPILEPPLGLMYLSSFLKAHGYREIKIIHMDAESLSLTDLEGVFKQYAPKVIGISALTAEALGLYNVAEVAKKYCRDSLIVAGGPYPTGCVEEVLNNSKVDIVVQGEGETALLGIIKNYEQGKSFDAIEGACFRANGGIIKRGRKNYIENLDSLPYPDWEAIPLEKYNNFQPQSLLIYKQNYMPLFTSRGCPFHCTYCHNIFGKSFRAHSAQRVIDEIKILHYKFGISNFEMLDDIFNFDRMRVVKIMERIIDNGLKIKLFFVNGVRGDMLDEELIDLFAKAGVAHIAVAVETASARLQSEIKKYASLDKIKTIISYGAKKKIMMHGFFMLGFPQETLREAWSTVKFAIASDLHLASFFLVHPFGGTALGSSVKENGKRTISAFDFSNYYFIIKNNSVNCSKFSNRQLQIIFALANILFYCNPARVFRIAKNMPYKGAIKLLFKQFFARVCGRG